MMIGRRQLVTLLLVAGSFAIILYLYQGGGQLLEFEATTTIYKTAEQQLGLSLLSLGDLQQQQPKVLHDDTINVSDNNNGHDEEEDDRSSSSPSSSSSMEKIINPPLELLAKNGTLEEKSQEFSSSSNSSRASGFAGSPPSSHQHDNLTQATTQFLKTNKSPHDAMLPLWMRDYIAFHRQAIEVAVPSSSPPPDPANGSNFSLKNGTRYLLWRCPPKKKKKKRGYGGRCGGIGDRLRGILTALYWALCTGRVFLIAYPVADPPLEDYLVPNHIQWLIADYKQLLRQSKHYNLHAMDRDKKTTDEMMNEVVNKARSYQGLVVHTNFPISEGWPREHAYMQRYWKQQHRGAPPPPEHRLPQIGVLALFRWSSRVNQRAQTLLKLAGMWKEQQQGAGAGGGQQPPPPPPPYVGIHIRSGEDEGEVHARFATGDENSSIYETTLSKVRQVQAFMTRCNDVISQQRGHYSHQDDKLPSAYIASDSARIKSTLLELDDSLHAVSKDQVTVRNVDHNFDNPSMDIVSSGQLDAFAELKILTEAFCLVRTASGFSRLALWFTNQTLRPCWTPVGPASRFAKKDGMLTRPFSELPCSYFDSYEQQH